MKRYILEEPHYIGGTLLAAGSIVTKADLGKSEAGTKLVEIDAKGRATDKDGERRLRQLGLSSEPVEIAPVSPHAPNPTAPQALPPHAVGEVLPAGRYVPADGVESDEAAEARAEQEAAATKPQRRKG